MGKISEAIKGLISQGLEKLEEIRHFVEGAEKRAEGAINRTREQMIALAEFGDNFPDKMLEGVESLCVGRAEYPINNVDWVQVQFNGTSIPLQTVIGRYKKFEQPVDVYLFVRPTGKAVARG